MSSEYNSGGGNAREPAYPARKSPLGELLVWLLVRSSLRRLFVRVRLRAPESDPRAYAVSLLGVANHSSWWDGYLALLLARYYGMPRYLMMETAQLKRYGFFAWAGCFGVDRADPRDVARSIAYAAHLLGGKQRPLVWIFPQAEIVSADARPITVHAGAAHVMRRATAQGQMIGILPVAWQLVFRGEQHPEVFIRVGNVWYEREATTRDTDAMSARIRTALTQEMDALRADLAANQLAAYRTVMQGKSGVNDLFDRLLHRTRLVDEP